MTPTQTVTLLFADLESSTELLIRLGEQEARRVWRTYLQLLRDSARAQNGQEVKSLGDGLMVVFQSASSAVACAVNMQKEIRRHNQQKAESSRLEIRIGLHVGEPIRENGDYFGTPVVFAKRLCECAKGGQIFASGTARRIAEEVGDFAFIDRGLQELKGFPKRCRVYEVSWYREETPAVFATSMRTELTPLVGREKELNELEEFLEQTPRGQGALVMIGGEPGVGKTRIAQEITAEACARGMMCLTGHCYEAEGTPPYIPFIEILESAIHIVKQESLLEIMGDSASEVARLMPHLRRQFPSIPPPPELPPEQERRSLFNAVCETIARASQAQPQFLILEDLQWADDSTTLLLQHLAGRLQEIPVLVIGTYRDADLDTARALAGMLESLRREKLVHRLTLERLQKPEVAAMLYARSGHAPPRKAVEIIYQKTEGNPFFVEEIFRHLTEAGKLFDPQGRWRTDFTREDIDVPESVRLLIGRRLEQAGMECSRVLQGAAIIGQRFGFELLKELVAVNEEALLDAIDAAERARLISPTTKAFETRFKFTHDLIRQTLIASMSLPRQHRLHLRVAETIEKVYAKYLDEHISDLAYHLYQAGAAAADLQKKVHYLVLAGDRSLQAAAFESALDFYENAISVLPSNNLQLRAELLQKRGMALRSMGDLDRALADWNDALDLYEKLGNREALGNLCADLAGHMIACRRTGEAYEIAQRGLAALGERVSPARARLLAAAGYVLSFIPAADYDSVHNMFTQARNIAKELDKRSLLGPILLATGTLYHSYWQGRQQVEMDMQAAEILRSAGDIYYTALALAFAQCGLIWAGHLDQAEKISSEAQTLARKVGNKIACWLNVHYGSLWAMAVTGDLKKFEKRRAASLQLSLNEAAAKAWVSIDYNNLGRAKFWLGRWKEAEEAFRKGAESDIHGIMNGFCSGMLFLFAAYRGERTEALDILQKSKEFLPQAGRPNAYGAWTLLEAAVEGLAVLEEWEYAGSLYPLVLEAVKTGNVIRASYSGLVQTIAGISATAARQWERAERHFETALRQAHEVPYKIEQAEVRRWYSRMMMERNAPSDQAKARVFLSEAISLYRSIGMPTFIENSEALLTRLQ